jgi:predicted flap endonuclease-1-like 5' DNA nuclease
MIFEELQFSAVVLCYGPLVLVVGGIIAFAILTDRQATRTYLRNLDPRSDRERGPATRVDVDKPTVAATPAGYTVAIQPRDRESVDANVPASAATAVEETPAVEAEPDNLKRIEGVGPKMATVLNEAGITTFAQLASYTPAELREILNAAGVAQITDPATWPEQAELAAAGDWAALDALQDDLEAGRR